MTIQMPFPPDARADDCAGLPARVVGLSGRQAAIFFDADASILPGKARVAALCDGRPFRGPVAVTRLGCQRGGERHVLLIARPAEDICNASVRIEADGKLLARIDPLALQSPLVDPLSLVSGLDEAGALRLLKLLLTTGASLFGKGDLGGFGMLVGQLLESLTSPVPLSAWCPVGRTAGILSWRLPPDVTLPALRDLCILHDGRARRFTDFTAVEEASGTETLLHLLIARPLPVGSDLIVLGEQPVRLGGPGPAAPRTLHGWMERRGPQARARTLDWLEGLASGDAQVSALRDELGCPPGSEPKLGVLHLSETPEGLFYMLSVDDRRGLVSAVRFSTVDGTTDMPCDRLDWHPRHGTVAFGFAPTSGRSGGQVAIAPVLLSGRTGAAVEAAPGAFDARKVEAFGDLGEPVAAPVLARALPSGMQARPVWRRRVTTFGRLSSAPGIALVVAAGEAPEHLHALMASLMAEPGARNAEVLVHHADGPSTDLLLQTAASLAAIHRAGIRLVSVAPEALPSERLRAALAETHAARMLILGPGALPTASGWLAAWRRRTGAGTGAAATWGTATGCDGAPRDEGEVVGLNAAAAARLIATRPRLSGIGPDLRVTPGLAHGKARGLSVRVYDESTGCGLVRAAERIAVETAKGEMHD